LRVTGIVPVKIVRMMNQCINITILIYEQKEIGIFLTTWKTINFCKGFAKAESSLFLSLSHHGKLNKISKKEKVN
jgi:hypothetical protein